MSNLIDNRAQRIRMLKHIIKHLHAGQAPEEVKAQLATLVRECDAGEIAAMEQELMAEGVPVHEIMSMCDLHSQVVRDILVERPHGPIVPGHPVDTFKRENVALGEKAAELRESVGALGDQADGEEMLRCRALFNDLMDVDKHYARKENLLFSCLERHGITGPSKVMWGKDDEVRAFLKELGALLNDDDAASGGSDTWFAEVQQKAEAALGALLEMIQKEERILLPMALQTLTEAEWGEIWSQSPEFGWCLVDPGDEYAAPDVEEPVVSEDVVAEVKSTGVALNILPADGLSPATRPTPPVSGSLVFPTGFLTLEQLKLIFGTLPIDVTFVDADDRVRFFSEGPERVFARPKAVIGRKVQHCHPPSSMDVVDRILDDFKSGRQSVAEFWIELHGRFVHIRYYALRDDDGAYQGTLEVTQDLTHERALEGERRLLQYDN